MRARLAEDADVEVFVAVLERVGAERRWILSEPPFDVAARAARLREGVANGDRLLVLEDDEGRIAGVMGLHRDPGLPADVRTLGMALLPEHRGAGHGGRLLDAGLELARAQAGIRALALEVFDDNPAAIALYRRRGFADLGLRPAPHTMRDGTVRPVRLMALTV